MMDLRELNEQPPGYLPCPMCRYPFGPRATVEMFGLGTDRSWPVIRLVCPACGWGALVEKGDRLTDMGRIAWNYHVREAIRNRRERNRSVWAIIRDLDELKEGD